MKIYILTDLTQKKEPLDLPPEATVSDLQTAIHKKVPHSHTLLTQPT